MNTQILALPIERGREHYIDIVTDDYYENKVLPENREMVGLPVVWAPSFGYFPRPRDDIAVNVREDGKHIWHLKD